MSWSYQATLCALVLRPRCTRTPVLYAKEFLGWKSKIYSCHVMGRSNDDARSLGDLLQSRQFEPSPLCLRPSRLPAPTILLRGLSRANTLVQRRLPPRTTIPTLAKQTHLDAFLGLSSPRRSINTDASPSKSTMAATKRKPSVKREEEEGSESPAPKRSRTTKSKSTSPVKKEEDDDDDDDFVLRRPGDEEQDAQHILPDEMKETPLAKLYDAMKELAKTKAKESKPVKDGIVVYWMRSASLSLSLGRATNNNSHNDPAGKNHKHKQEQGPSDQRQHGTLARVGVCSNAQGPARRPSRLLAGRLQGARALAASHRFPTAPTRTPSRRVGQARHSARRVLARPPQRDPEEGVRRLGAVASGGRVCQPRVRGRRVEARHRDSRVGQGGEGERERVRGQGRVPQRPLRRRSGRCRHQGEFSLSLSQEHRVVGKENEG